MIKVFKDIPSYEGYYQVSNLGRVKSLKRTVKGRWGDYKVKEKILKIGRDKDGYGLHVLCVNGKNKTHKLHHLVLMSFNIKEWELRGCRVVDHIDNDRMNNSLINLQLLSIRENSSKDRIGKSKYTGVTTDSYGMFISQIQINGKKIYLGYFKEEIDAHNAYQNKLKQL